jgi:hypothetical protein
MCGTLKVSGLIFEMVSSLEMYIIYCANLVMMPALCLRSLAAHVSVFETLSRSVSTCSTKNSDILALSLRDIKNLSVPTSISKLNWL